MRTSESPASNDNHPAILIYKYNTIHLIIISRICIQKRDISFCQHVVQEELGVKLGWLDRTLAEHTSPSEYPTQTAEVQQRHCHTVHCSRPNILGPVITFRTSSHVNRGKQRRFCSNPRLRVFLCPPGSSKNSETYVEDKEPPPKHRDPQAHQHSRISNQTYHNIISLKCRSLDQLDMLDDVMKRRDKR